MDEIANLVGGNNDPLFGLVSRENDTLTFCIADLLRKHGLMEGIYTKISFKEENGMTWIVANRNHNEIQRPATKELITFITNDYGLKDFEGYDTAIKDYIALINHCLKPELKDYVYGTKRGTKSRGHKAFEKEFERLSVESNKHLLNERFKVGRGLKGYSYKDLATQEIIIPPDTSDQLRRVFILLGSCRAGNNNPECLAEFSGLLDALYKDQRITKAMYKILYYKMKTIIDSNSK